MDKITDKIAALPQDANYCSLEFFPPKTQMGSANLQARLERMSRALRPLFVTVTWGAGGTTAAKSLELAEICQRQLGLTTCLHLTCTNMNRTLIDEALDEAKALGIRNILALRGDPPRSGEYDIGEDDSNKEFTFAVDLVRYIRRKHGDHFCVGVAAYPEGHADESHPEVQNPTRDMPYLLEKTKAGADFIMTQLTYDLEAYRKFESLLRNHESGVFKTMPIIAGLMPIQSYQNLRRIAKLSHAHVPAQILSRIEQCRPDDEAVKVAGVDILSEIVEGIKALPTSGPRGLHFYTLNLEKSVSFIVERCNLIPPSTEPSSGSESESEAAVSTGGWQDGIVPTAEGKPFISKRRASSINSQPQNRVIMDTISSGGSASHETPAHSAGYPALNPPPRNTTLLISEGLGSLGREATWDDFPNGRWGDARSPAFGEIDGYGPSLPVPTTVARRLWGYPVSREDISSIFRRHVSGELYAVPWSEGGAEEDSAGLNAETDTIREDLLKLIDGRGWWTLASQPAVNGVRSDDPVFGWGPPGGGFVFQKAFVEFFCPKEEFQNCLKPLLNRCGHDEFAWLATNAAGDFESSATGPIPTPTGPVDAALDTDFYDGPNPDNVNAVTWGVFRGKEIITPTIIEEVSFRAWGEEAFRIWDEWRQLFPHGSATERLLGQLKKDVWLVCVIGQRFGAGGDPGNDDKEDEGKRLWKVLAGEEEKVNTST